MNRLDSHLSVRTYLETLEGVETQFALIRFALNALSKNAIKGFFEAHLQNQIDAFSASFAKFKAGLPSEDVAGWNQTEIMVRDSIKKKHRKDSKPSDARFKIELSEDRLNQSELLLLVAHFESFMKDVHRTFLTAAPAKVFSKRNTKFTLSKAFQDGADGYFSKFLNELVIKEVRSLDSQRIEQRAEYFAKHFGVSFSSPKEIQELREIMDTRNKISHEIYCPPPRSAEHVREQPLVSDQMLKRSRQLFRDIPSRCVNAGSKVYPSYFR